MQDGTTQAKAGSPGTEGALKISKVRLNMAGLGVLMLEVSGVSGR
jgi:hypothetical protein